MCAEKGIEAQHRTLKTIMHFYLMAFGMYNVMSK